MSSSMAAYSKLASYLLAARPKTLAAAVVPILVATALSAFELKLSGKKTNYMLSVYALLSTLFIQIGTNLVNDALDFKKGADTHTRMGPVRATQNGLLTFKQVLTGGVLSFGIAALCGIPLILHSGLPILVLGILSLMCGYLYTGGPYPLAYVGLGDLFVVVFFGIGAICGVTFLHTGTVTQNAVVASLQIGFLATTLIAINNFRDHTADKLVNKLTLAARFGKSFARFEICALFVLTFALNFYWFFKGLYLVGLLPLLSLPLAIKVVYGILKNPPSPLFNNYLGMAAGVQLIFGVGMSIAFFF